MVTMEPLITCLYYCIEHHFNIGDSSLKNQHAFLQHFQKVHIIPILFGGFDGVKFTLLYLQTTLLQPPFKHENGVNITVFTLPSPSISEKSSVHQR